MSEPETERYERGTADTLAERAAFLTSEAGRTGDPGDRQERLAGLAAAARASSRGAGRGARAGQKWLTGQVTAMAPRLRARDLTALRAQYPGLGTEELADALIDDAARASMAVGAAVGTWAMLPLLPVFPAEVTAEVLAAVGIEVKLVAELHEAYQRPAPGSQAEQMAAYTAAWGTRRPVDLGAGGVSAASPHPVRVIRRLASRSLKTVLSFGPFFLGALFGARMNRRETRRVGRKVRKGLRRQVNSAARVSLA